MVRKITLRKGGAVYAVDQGEISELACLRPIGQFTAGILIVGSVETFSRSSYSGLLFQALVKLLEERTHRIGNFWVGPAAEKQLRLGWRLVTGVASPQEYDLAL
ncbi:MAG: hypothetical protein EOO60_11940 [Hymenobacter sp.]|nr:MAG: hypothetical protein EOO60_11940 [Hymenobacter sp.]